MASGSLSMFWLGMAVCAAVLPALASAQTGGSSLLASAPRPECPGWMARHESFNARVRQGDVNLLFVGDSVVQGWAASGRAAWHKFYGRRKAVNLGIAGDQAQHILWRLDHGNLEGISPKLAVLMLGGDCGRGSTPQEISAGTKAVVEKLRAKLPNTKVLLLGIFPRGKDNHDPWRQINSKVNERISTLADGKMVFYLDIGPKLVAPDGTASKEILRDLVHLSAKGYAIWAEETEPMVAELMGEK